MLFRSTSASGFGQRSSQGSVRIKCGIEKARITKMVRPKYPEQAKQAGIQGTVSLRCWVGRNGSVQKVAVSSGDHMLVPAAVDAVSRWRFEPLLLNGKAVEVETQVDVIFRLSAKRPTRKN